MESLNDIVSSINGVLWSSVIIVLLVGAGVYFTIRTKAVQLRYFGTMFKLIANTAGTKTEGNEISPFQAFCVSTASRVGVGNIAGSYVLDGVFQRNCQVRITRDGEQIFEGALASLKRFKDDVKEVKAGYECGFVFANFNDIKEGDLVEAFKMVEVPR